MLGLTPHAHPATPRLQLFHQHQQFIPGILGKDGAGHVDNVGLEELHQGEVLQHKFCTATDPVGDLRAKANVSRQQVDPNSLGSKSAGGGKHHLAAPATQIEEALAFLQPGQPANLQSREIGRFSESKIRKRTVRQRSALQINIQRQKPERIKDPHESLHRYQRRNPEQCGHFSGSLEENGEGFFQPTTRHYFPVRFQ